MTTAVALSEVSVASVLKQAVAALAASDSAALDAQLLLAHSIGKSKTWLYAWPEAVLDSAALQHFEVLLKARIDGMPVAYLLGAREFWNLSLAVSPAVLIPRPETELLVETALTLGPVGAATVADLGAGSGAICLALASERPLWTLHATEICPAALAVAQRNRQALALDNVRLLHGSWCEPLTAPSYDLIISNPPYIDADDAHLQQGDVRFEPRQALIAGEQGLQDIREIARQALPRLRPAGWLLVEHGWQQGAAVRDILEQAGFQRVQTRCDAGGRERMSMGCPHE
jgi:release factor glutamine methyltransferase